MNKTIGLLLISFVLLSTQDVSAGKKVPHSRTSSTIGTVKQHRNYKIPLKVKTKVLKAARRVRMITNVILVAIVSLAAIIYYFFHQTKLTEGLHSQPDAQTDAFDAAKLFAGGPSQLQTCAANESSLFSQHVVTFAANVIYVNAANAAVKLFIGPSQLQTCAADAPTCVADTNGLCLRPAASADTFVIVNAAAKLFIEPSQLQTCAATNKSGSFSQPVALAYDLPTGAAVAEGTDAAIAEDIGTAVADSPDPVQPNDDVVVGEKSFRNFLYICSKFFINW
jgi:hypothetical protein